jgi:6-phosphogluconolactonase
VQLSVAPSPQEAADLAAAWVARRIRSAVRRRSICRVALSGGGTPVLMFDALAGTDLPWDAVHVFQVDERVAPDGHPDRNATQLTEHLTDRVRIPRRNVHLMPVTAASLSRGCTRYATALGGEALDIVHLGIGDDGHTASWPPGDPVIDVTDPVALSGVFNGWVRMTLTPGVVNAARARIVLVSGASKAAPLAAWLGGGAGLPVARIRRGGTTVVVDAPAAAQLPDA